MSSCTALAVARSMRVIVPFVQADPGQLLVGGHLDEVEQRRSDGDHVEVVVVDALVGLG